ncbi:hypothetical protein L596_002502 [Steinernema carpocapsae]|uniref:Uncharacterized protein n=1 Tax=Steinernema carpocapsae TaxID=34508 RepID=A0A4U8UPD3_STECR|nr:hypothetical protein L596_002502 [Steinernema carpocapsae]
MHFDEFRKRRRQSPRHLFPVLSAAPSILQSPFDSQRRRTLLTVYKPSKMIYKMIPQVTKRHKAEFV